MAEQETGSGSDYSDSDSDSGIPNENANIHTRIPNSPRPNKIACYNLDRYGYPSEDGDMIYKCPAPCVSGLPVMNGDQIVEEGAGGRDSLLASHFLPIFSHQLEADGADITNQGSI